MKVFYKFLFFFFLTLSFHLHAQADALDSLNAALKKATHDTTRINILTSLAAQCDYEDIEKYAEPCIRLCEKGLAAASNNSQKKFYLDHLGAVLSAMGVSEQVKGDNVKALSFYRK
ncbi:MAG: hypothetical protein K0S12_1381 [Bacteroidetes bacterium]|nr:hypothetical protein [Bacteroidota bacterium]